MHQMSRTILRSYITSLATRLEQASDQSRENRERIIAEVFSLVTTEVISQATNAITAVRQEVSDLALNYKSEED